MCSLRCWRREKGLSFESLESMLATLQTRNYARAEKTYSGSSASIERDTRAHGFLELKMEEE
jgi:hypothetical protein